MTETRAQRRERIALTLMAAAITSGKLNTSAASTDAILAGSAVYAADALMAELDKREAADTFNDADRYDDAEPFEATVSEEDNFDARR